MPTGLEQVHAVTEQAMRQLDAEARRLNRSINDTRADIVKAKAEYEQLGATIAEAKTELDELRKKKAAFLKEIDVHRDEQLAVMEKAGAQLVEQTKKVNDLIAQSEKKEQEAQTALSDFLIEKGRMHDRVTTLHQALHIHLVSIDEFLKV